METNLRPEKKAGTEAVFKTFEPLTRKFNGAKNDENNDTTNFEFVNAEGPSQPKTASRRAARAHVMRRYHNERRNQTLAESTGPNKDNRRSNQQDQMPSMMIEWRTPIPSRKASSTPSEALPSANVSLNVPNIFSELFEPTEPSHQCSTGSSNSKQVSQVSQCICIQAHPSPGLQPVFQGAIPLKHRSLQLLQFSVHEVARLNIPMGMDAEISWFTQATSHPAFFHGTLLLGATYRALTLGQTPPFPAECYYHQGEAIRHIIANLENPESQLEDGNVAAVACLVAFETAVDHVANGSVHVDGLERLISTRRAKNQEAFKWYLERLVQWVDVSHASANLTRPRFFFIPSNIPISAKLNLDDETHLLETLDSKWPPSFPSSPITMYEGMDEVTVYIFHRVRQLSSLASTIHGCNPRSEAIEELRQQYTHGMLLLEGQVNASIWSLSKNNVRQWGSTTQPRADDTVRSCTRTWHGTCLLYIHLFLRRANPNPRSVVIFKVAKRVKYSLGILSETELWVSFPKPFLLWVLCVVGVAESGIGQLPTAVGHNMTDRLWLLQILGKLRHLMGLESWEVAKSILTQFAWVDHLCDAPSRALWEDCDRYLMGLSEAPRVAEIWSPPPNPSSLYGPNLPDHVVNTEVPTVSNPSKEFPCLYGQEPSVLSSS